MKKLIIISLIIYSLFSFFAAECGKKTRKKTHKLIVENVDVFQGFISDFLFKQTAHKYNPDATGQDSLFFEYFNEDRVSVEVVSNVPLEQKDIEDCLPKLKLKNNDKRESDPIVVWDIRYIENRVLSFIRAKKLLTAKKLSKKNNNIFEKYPYYCAGMGILSTGICCGVSGWLLHAWWMGSFN